MNTDIIKLFNSTEEYIDFITDMAKKNLPEELTPKLHDIKTQSSITTMLTLYTEYIADINEEFNILKFMRYLNDAYRDYIVKPYLSYYVKQFNIKDISKCKFYEVDIYHFPWRMPTNRYKEFYTFDIGFNLNCDHFNNVNRHIKFSLSYFRDNSSLVSDIINNIVERDVYIYDIFNDNTQEQMPKSLTNIQFSEFKDNTYIPITFRIPKIDIILTDDNQPYVRFKDFINSRHIPNISYKKATNLYDIMEFIMIDSDELDILKNCDIDDNYFIDNNIDKALSESSLILIDKDVRNSCKKYKILNKF